VTPPLLVPRPAVRQLVQAREKPMAVLPVDEAPARQPRRERRAQEWSRQPRFEVEKAMSWPEAVTESRPVKAAA
jgi:hypothetical protein